MAEPAKAVDKKKDALAAQVPQGGGLIQNMSAHFNIEPQKFLEVLRGTVIKPDAQGRAATNEEIAAFMIVADKYGLNPFIREIYAFRGKGGGIVPIIPIDGWITIINRQESYQGVDFIDKLDPETGELLAVTCRMYRSDRNHTTEVTEYMDECKRETEPWKQWPNRMLRHKAMIQAARYCFGLVGIYDEDEAERIISVAPVSTPAGPKRLSSSTEPVPAPATATQEPSQTVETETSSQPTMFQQESEQEANGDALISPAEVEKFLHDAFEIGWKRSEILQYLAKEFHVKDVKDLRKSQYPSALSAIQQARG